LKKWQKQQERRAPQESKPPAGMTPKELKKWRKRQQ